MIKKKDDVVAISDAATKRIMTQRTMELLAPAGDSEAFEIALHAGADAIYLGLKDFSARKSAENFSVENLGDFVRLAHVFGAKVYVALNTLIKEKEVYDFADEALQSWNSGADALIVQDLFLGKRLKEHYPEIELHLSTQAGVCNEDGAKLAKDFGFSRVILARETPLADIERISKVIETECFVQGALCTCFSGQCYFSSVIGGNSGNRGFCKQPCRKRYAIDRLGFEKFAYRLSLSDLCVGANIDVLARVGVSSCKIEGRMRSAAYVGAAVRYYRDLLDGEHESLAKDLSALKRTFNRGNYTQGYLFGQDQNLLASDIQGHIGEPIGIIGRRDKSRRYVFVRSEFAVHDRDGFKVIRKSKEEIGGAIWRNYYPAVKGGFYLPCDKKFREGDEVCVTSDMALTKRLQTMRRKVTLQFSLRLYAEKPLFVQVKGAFGTYEASSEFIAEVARTRPTSAQELTECFEKVDGLPFSVCCDHIETDGASFIVRSQLNAFRRKVWTDIYQKLSNVHPPITRRVCLEPISPQQQISEGLIAVIDRDFASPCYRKVKVDFAILDPIDCRDKKCILNFLQNSKRFAKQRLIYLPAYCTGEDILLYKNLLPLFDGVYAEGNFAFQLCKGLPIFAGTGLNLFNRFDVDGALRAGAMHIALSKELSLAEIEEINVSSAFVFAGGRTRVMDLGHCPFQKTCASCDRRAQYTLEDEAGRKFPLLRNMRSVCRFAIYNCMPMRINTQNYNKLFDFSASTEQEKESILLGKVGAFTAGTSKNGIR